MIDAGWAQPDELAVVEVVENQRDALAELLPGVDIRTDPLPGVDAVVAVKPYHLLDVCRNLPSPRRVLSIAAGITLHDIEAALPAGTPAIRAMPNTPALVGAGAAGLAGGTHASADDVAWAETVLGAVGIAVSVNEAQLDAVTGLSGSGPAYLFLLAEALTDAGVAEGLPRPVADRLARQTIFGAGKMLVQDGADPVELRAGVTTPAGTTAAGLAALEDRGLRAAAAAAVRAAAERATELGAST
jgi:pyrroline-5-carboxylate reductase